MSPKTAKTTSYLIFFLNADIHISYTHKTHFKHFGQSIILQQVHLNDIGKKKCLLQYFYENYVGGILRNVRKINSLVLKIKAPLFYIRILNI